MSGAHRLDRRHLFCLWRFCGDSGQSGTNLRNAVSQSVLRLQSCNGLKSLPQAITGSLTELDLSYCSEVDSLAESLLKLESALIPPCQAQTAAKVQEGVPNAVSGSTDGSSHTQTTVVLQGWGELLGVLKKDDERDGRVDGRILITKRVVHKLRCATIVQKLLSDRDTIMEMLSRLSWLGVLLASATFTAAIAPPGGYNNGLLFMDYGEYYSPRSSLAPDSSTPKPNAAKLQAFFVLDLLSFGFSMTLVMFVVACSIPRTGRYDPEASAGLIWLSLVLASTLLILAVGCGMVALLVGLLSVYPESARGGLLQAGGVSLAMMGLMTFLLLRRWTAIFPGKRAFTAAWGIVGQDVGSMILAIPGVRRFWDVSLEFARPLIARAAAVLGNRSRTNAQQSSSAMKASGTNDQLPLAPAATVVTSDNGSAKTAGGSRDSCMQGGMAFIRAEAGLSDH